MASAVLLPIVLVRLQNMLPMLQAIFVDVPAESSEEEKLLLPLWTKLSQGASGASYWLSILALQILQKLK